MRIVAKDKNDAIEQYKELLSKGFDVSNVEVQDENGEKINLNIELVQLPEEEEVDEQETQENEEIEMATESDKSVDNAQKVDKKVDTGKRAWARKVLKDYNAGDMTQKTTLSTDVDAAVVAAVGEVVNEVFGGKLLPKLTRVNMDTPTLRLPAFYLSGTAGTTTESGAKNAADLKDKYVQLETECYNAYVGYSKQAKLNLPALEGYISEQLTGAIEESLDAAAVAAIVGASGKYEYSVESVSGWITQEDMVNMYLHLEQKNLKNPAWLVHPIQFSKIMQFDSGVRAVSEGPYMSFYGIEIIPVASLTTPAETASGSVILTGLGNTALGVQGDIMEDFNPFFGWTTNLESIRMEIFADIEPMSLTSFTRDDGADSGWETSYYVVYATTPVTT